MEHLIGTMEAHKWGYTSLAGIDAVAGAPLTFPFHWLSFHMRPRAAAEYEVNKDAYVSWPGAMTDKQFYGHEQACARRCVAAQLAAHDTIINIHGDNEYLVSLASARLNGSDDLGINQALAELNLSEEQVCVCVYACARPLSRCVCVYLPLCVCHSESLICVPA